MVAEMAPGTTAAGVLTRSKCPSAPVDWCRAILPRGKARVLVVNSGNANAFTGNAGDLQVAQTAGEAANLFGCRAQDVYIASTGVIGEPRAAGLYCQQTRAPEKDPVGEILEGCRPGHHDHRHLSLKAASRKVKVGKAEVTLSGFAKGSGMIAPDMATMLGFVFTDAKIPAPVLQRLVRSAARMIPSTPSPSTATPRRRTPCCCSPPVRPRASRASPVRPTRRSPTSRRPCGTSSSTWPSRSCGTGRARRNSSPSM